MQTRPFTPTDFDVLIAFVAHFNAEPAHHIGYFGTDSVAIRGALNAISPPLGEGFRLAFDGDRLVGVLGVEIDHTIGRAWLFGPLIDHPKPDAVADALYTALRPTIPASIHEYELFCDFANEVCQRFAVRHGIPFHGEAAILYYERDAVPALPSYTAADLDDVHVDAFRKLHEQSFPNTYAPAQRLLDERSNHARILTVTVDGQLHGYVAAKVELQAGAGYTDYIAVAETARGHGVGRTLLAAALGWMFAFPEVQRSDLTVSTSNNAALHLYRSLGFQQERVMRAYRTTASAPA